MCMGKANSLPVEPFFAQEDKKKRLKFKGKEPHEELK